MNNNIKNEASPAQIKDLKAMSMSSWRNRYYKVHIILHSIHPAKL